MTRGAAVSGGVAAGSCCRPLEQQASAFRMPDLAMIDAYRRLAAGALGRRIVEVVAPDEWYLREGPHRVGAR